MSDRTGWAVRALAALVMGAGSVLPTASPGWAQTQELGANCEIQSARVLTSSESFAGQRVTRLGLPVVLCDDGVRVQSDSAVHYHQQGRTEFIGAFRYGDLERELQVESADYFETQGRLFARGRVAVIPRDGGSRVEGDSLTLFEGAEGPEDDQVLVRGNPATADIQPEAAEPGAEPASSFRVTASQIRFEGTRYLYADGDVEVDRDSLHATSASLVFDQELGSLSLSGGARMQTAETDLTGDSIHVSLPDDEIRAITVSRAGRLESGDIELEGDEIRIDFVEEEIERLVAVMRGARTGGAGPPGAAGPQPGQPTPAPGSNQGPDAGTPDAESTDGAPPPRGPQPRAWTETFVLTADSLDIRTPAGALDSVYAIGRARGESREAGRPSREAGPPVAASDTVVVGVSPDSADVVEDPVETDVAAADSLEMPGDDDPTRAFLRHDWIEGDTIIATFLPAGAARADSVEAADPGVPDADADAPPTDAPQPADEEAEYRLDRLLALGNARTLYRSPPERENGEAEAEPAPARDRWAISYFIADSIALQMSDGEVRDVRATGGVTGYHGEPVAEPSRPPPEPPAPTDGDSIPALSPDATATREVTP